MITTSHLTKSYGDFRAIDEVSFEIGQGECVGLLGLNGAGKTTLLRLLSCLLTPSSGTASIDNFDVVLQSHQVRQRIGFLPEVPPVYDEMLVSAFLEFAARLRGVDETQVESRVAQATQRCQLQEVVHQRIDTLSYGFKKRVGIAQAIVHHPPLVILDEPIAGLDPAQIVEMRELIRNLRGQHTILLSSHILSEISQTCDRILVIHRGRIAAQGTEDELLGKRAHTADLRLQVKGEPDLVESTIKATVGVVSYRHIEESNGVQTVMVGTEGECRARLAAAIVQAELDLLQLTSGREDLESVFLKLTDAREDSP